MMLAVLTIILTSIVILVGSLISKLAADECVNEEGLFHKIELLLSISVFLLIISSVLRPQPYISTVLVLIISLPIIISSTYFFDKNFKEKIDKIKLNTVIIGFLLPLSRVSAIFPLIGTLIIIRNIISGSRSSIERIGKRLEESSIKEAVTASYRTLTFFLGGSLVGLLTHQILPIKLFSMEALVGVISTIGIGVTFSFLLKEFRPFAKHLGKG